MCPGFGAGARNIVWSRSKTAIGASSSAAEPSVMLSTRQISIRPEAIFLGTLDNRAVSQITGEAKTEVGRPPRAKKSGNVLLADALGLEHAWENARRGGAGRARAIARRPRSP